MNRIVIFGSGGHAKVVIEAIQLGHPDDCIVGVLNNDPVESGNTIRDVPVLGNDELLPNLVRDENCNTFVVAIGGLKSFSLRHRLSQTARDAGLKPFFVRHSTAVVSPSAEIAEGCQLLAQSVINAEARLEQHVIVNTSAIVEHDCHVHDFSHVAPRACLAGGAIVGPETHIGMGALILENRRVGANCVIGAGAVVLGDVPDGTVVAGVPAKPIAAAKTIRNTKS